MGRTRLLLLAVLLLMAAFLAGYGPVLVTQESPTNHATSTVAISSTTPL